MSKGLTTIYPSSPMLVRADEENPVRISVGQDTLRYGTSQSVLSSTLSAGQTTIFTANQWVQTDGDAAVVIESYDPWAVLEGPGIPETIEGDVTFTGSADFTDATVTGISVAADPDLETITGSQAKVDTHSADTSNVHGITDTTALETTTGAQTKVDTHNAVTTSVHGISNTANVPDQTGTETVSGAWTFTSGDTDVTTTELAVIREAATNLKFPTHGVVGDGVTDDTAAVVSWINALESTNRRGYVPQGTYLIDYIDETISENLDIECHPDAVFLGEQDWQDFSGDGATTSFTITAFAWYAAGQGVNVDVVDNGTGLATPLTEDEDYTITGAVINTAAGSSPYGAVAVGDTLRVSGSAPILTLRSTDKRINWRGGQFDGSNRGFSLARPSGSALALNGWRGVDVNADFYGAGDDYMDARADLLSDSGLTLTNCESATVKGYFKGWGDLGLYVTGDSDSGAADNGSDLRVEATFVGCETGMKSVRQFERSTICSNFVTCGTGVLNGLTGSPALAGGSEYIIIGSQFKNTGRRAIDLRFMAEGATVIGNRIEDVGFNPDGTTPHTLPADGTTEPTPAGVSLLEGVPSTRVTGNVFGMVDWTGDNNQRAVAISGTGAELLGAKNMAVSHNTIKGFPSGIVESGTAGNFSGQVYEDNVMVGVTTPYTIVATNTRYSWFRASDETRWAGKGSSTWRVGVGNTWTPTLVWSGGGGGFNAASIARASYTRDPLSGLVTAHFELTQECTSEGSGELRVSGLPFTVPALANDTPRPGGSIQALAGPITGPAGTTWFTLRPNAGGTTISILAQDSTPPLSSTAIDTTHTTTGTFTVSGSVSYIVS